MAGNAAKRKPYPPNNFCPCRSGQKYKKCCLPKNVEYMMRGDGKIVRESGTLEFDDLAGVIEQDLIKSGASDEVLYAFRKTGIVVTRENEAQVTPEELQQWESAILEFRKQSS